MAGDLELWTVVQRADRLVVGRVVMTAAPSVDQ